MSRLLRHLLAVMLLALCQLAATSAQAQTTVTADWTALGKVNFQSISNGTVLNVGPNSVTINTSVVTDGDGNDGNFEPYYSTGFLSYYTGTVGSQTGTLFYSMDHSVFDVGDYFESTYTLATAVTNLRFTVANVDRLNTGPLLHDGVIIEYDTGTGSWQNLRSLTSAYTLGSAVGTTTLNGVNGFHGTAYPGSITSTNGDIRVNFGTTSIKRVRIRYLFGQASPTSNPSGANQYIGLSDFVWTQAGVTTADLSMSKTVSNANPTAGSSISFTLTVTNGGPGASNGVVVRDQLPTGFTFTSATGTGSYNSATGDWTVGNVPSGASRSLTITGTVSSPAGVPITNIAEVYSTSSYDPDSVPGNSVTTEDDMASATFTVTGTRTAGTPPTLVCTYGSTLFDWDTRAWSAGSTSNSYAVTGIGTVSFGISTSGFWVNDATFGGQSPALSAANTGGLAGGQVSLHQYLDFSNRSQTAVTTIGLSNAVTGAQFTIFDIDYAANDFADLLTITGQYQGSTVYPTLTNGTANYIIGNTAIGDATSANNQGNGNLTVTFSSPIDTITIVYGNANTAPSDPDGQAIALHDITFCNPHAAVSVTKVSSVVSDPISGTTNPKAIPGARIDYVISIGNSGASATDSGSVVITDAGPPQASMCFNTGGSGQPVVFTDGSPASGLTYTYVAPTNATDNLYFSADGGVTWTYQPTLDGDGCDSAITHFQIRPTGQILAGRNLSFRTTYRLN